jgi:hypothetical protein
MKISIVLALLLAAAPSAGADDDRSRSADAVVELFTSQGCYSCPPADALLGELLEQRPGIVALEFHVDYWDTLAYGGAGTWRDPFSDPAFTLRQRRYHALSLSGRRGVYTPQMIVNGAHALVGSDRGALKRVLASSAHLPVDVRVAPDGNALAVRIDGADEYADASVWQADFVAFAKTPVGGGENHGKVLSNHNIVTSLRHIGTWRGGRATFAAERSIAPDTGCAVILEGPTGNLVGAAYCPP